jgi:hypothetical protein
LLKLNSLYRSMPQLHERESSEASQDATVTSSTSSRRQYALREDCERCSEWLSAALQASRPAKLLNAMGGSIVRSSNTGNFAISLQGEEQSILNTPPLTSKRLSPQSTQRSINTASKPAGNGLSSSSTLQSESSPGVLLGSSASKGTDLPVVTSLAKNAPNNSTPINVLSRNTTDPVGGKNAVSRTGQEDAMEGQEDAMEVQCAVCGTDGPEGAARAFVKGPNPVAVVLCANRLHSQSEVEEVLVHELMHVYDVRIKEMDLRYVSENAGDFLLPSFISVEAVLLIIFSSLCYSNCQQLAYSEVRAAREAECHGSSRFFKSICVKDRATIATKNMFPSQGRDCVRAVFEAAMKDDSPFSGGSTKLFFGDHHEESEVDGGPSSSSSR